MICDIYSTLLKQFNRLEILPDDIAYWFTAKDASKSLKRDIAKHYAHTKAKNGEISLICLANALAKPQSKTLEQEIPMQKDDISAKPEDIINASLAKTQLAMMFFEQLGRRAVLPFAEAAENLFKISGASAEAKLKSGKFSGLAFTQLEAGNRKSRLLVSVYDLADYYLKSREIAVLSNLADSKN